jgi:hypothetical protein
MHTFTRDMTTETFAGTLPAIQRTTDHRYTMAGITVDGVTGIIESIGSNFTAASSWGANQTAEAAIRLLPELPKMVETLGELGARKALTERKNWTRDDAAQLGTDVHALAEMLSHGKPLPEMTPRQKVRVEHYARWWESAGLRVRLTEAMVYRPADEMSAGWGGTFDLLAFDADERTVLADVKTGRLYPKVACQLAAYGMAKYVQPATATQVYPMPLPDRYMVIHVTEEGCKPIEVSVGSPERMAFLAALEIHQWLKTMKGKL